MYITLKGLYGSTSEQLLSSGASGNTSFERGNVDTFPINVKDLGDLQSVLLRLVSTLRDRDDATMGKIGWTGIMAGYFS